MSRFNGLDHRWQWVIITLCTLLLLLSGITWFLLILSCGFFILALPLFSSLFHFLVTPLYTRLKVFDHLSPMLLVNLPSPKVYELHHGTSFDYMLNIDRIKSGNLKRNIAIDYLEGLCTIIQRIENNQLSSDVIIKGSTYFIEYKTAKRFGFSIQDASWKDILFLAINYIDLTWMYSLTKNRLDFPNIMRAKTLTTTGAALMAHKTSIWGLHDKLKIQ
jgi:hypothetical protein